MKKKVLLAILGSFLFISTLNACGDNSSNSPQQSDDPQNGPVDDNNDPNNSNQDKAMDKAEIISLLNKVYTGCNDKIGVNTNTDSASPKNMLNINYNNRFTYSNAQTGASTETTSLSNIPNIGTETDPTSSSATMMKANIQINNELIKFISNVYTKANFTYSKDSVLSFVAQYSDITYNLSVMVIPDKDNNSLRLNLKNYNAEVSNPFEYYYDFKIGFNFTTNTVTSLQYDIVMNNSGSTSYQQQIVTEDGKFYLFSDTPSDNYKGLVEANKVYFYGLIQKGVVASERMDSELSEYNTKSMEIFMKASEAAGGNGQTTKDESAVSKTEWQNAFNNDNLTNVTITYGPYCQKRTMVNNNKVVEFSMTDRSYVYDLTQKIKWTVNSSTTKEDQYELNATDRWVISLEMLCPNFSQFYDMFSYNEVKKQYEYIGIENVNEIITNSIFEQSNAKYYKVIIKFENGRLVKVSAYMSNQDAAYTLKEITFSDYDNTNVTLPK